FVTVAFCPGAVITMRLPGRLKALLFPVIWISTGKVHTLGSAGVTKVMSILSGGDPGDCALHREASVAVAIISTAAVFILSLIGGSPFRFKFSGCLPLS